ncbi:MULTISPECIES: DedA family protein [unclassified Sphingobium]|uniref:DedA family protein n=1 Tax=unclassified Sphingobium TaxID=2611147 RepID=UPI0022250874|nr:MULTISPECIES: DedA family protein [unclassified Sphingobium]MCW2350561.1 membrane protein DedA with SNARE-associated domain [Sphingobium sp. B12D2B]MCW2369663.1 membrane protein DedA with SNARE-associated domain [Sphingobium sp. B11D3D]
MQDWVFDIVESTGLFGVFLLMLLETVFPPIPSEVIMPVAGVLAARGGMGLGGVILAGTAGAMAGNLFWYALARMIGLHRFRPLIERYGRWLTLDWPEVERAQGLFRRFGGPIVMIGRVLPTIRSVISIPAGVLRMRLIRFFVWSAVGTAAWSSGLAIAGWVLGRRFSNIEQFLGPLSTGIILLIVLIYIWRQATWHRRHVAADKPDVGE